MVDIKIHFDRQEWRDFARQPIDLLARAVRKGMTEVATSMKEGMRQHVRAAGLGHKLGNAIGSAVDPAPRSALGAAAVVYARSVNADRILDGFSTGAVIRARNGGRYLCIPTKFTPPLPWGEKWWTPALLLQRFGAKRIHLQWKSNGNGIVWLNPAATGQGRRGGERALPMLILAAEANLPKRLSPEQVAEQWAGRAPQIIEKAVDEGIGHG